MHWRPTFSAPKDGSKIIALYNDFSGVKLMFWGELHRGGHAWIEADCTDSDEDLKGFAGWIPAPENTPDFGPDG
ncbi:MAG: hypothetical protein ACJ8AD_14795 [Gemmatimonadaceae bacterium]